MRFDPKSNSIARLAVNPVAKTATFTESTVIDMKGFRYARILVILGAISGTTPDLDLVFSAGAASNGSDAVAITGAAIANLAAADANTVKQGLIDLKKVGNRYLSIDGTVSGTTPSFLIGVVVELMDALDTELFTQDTYAFSV